MIYMMEEVRVCIICQTSGLKSLILSSRVESFRIASRLRGDGVSDLLETDAESFRCHKNCISTYCSKDHIQRFLKRKNSGEKASDQSNAPKRLRGRAREFNFLKQCLFCGEECELERSRKNPSRWRKAYLCRTAYSNDKTAWKDNILEHAIKRGDTWGSDVAFRTNSALSDLHAAEARYHKDCMVKFFSNKPAANTDGLMERALDELITEMKSDHSRIWNSRELHNLYQQLGGKNLSRRALIGYLEDALLPDILVLTSPGVSSIIVFKNNASSRLRIEDDGEDEFLGRAIASLSKKIRAECLQHQPDPYTYPTRLTTELVSGKYYTVYNIHTVSFFGMYMYVITNFDDSFCIVSPGSYDTVWGIT